MGVVVVVQKWSSFTYSSSSWTRRDEKKTKHLNKPTPSKEEPCGRFVGGVAKSASTARQQPTWSDGCRQDDWHTARDYFYVLL